jgi:uncharacterized protein
LKEQLERLRELQNIDLEIDGLKTKRDSRLEKLRENRGFLDGLVADLDNQKNELAEIRQLQSQKQGDLKEINEQHKLRKKRLNDVSSTKEYNAVEKELEVIKKSLEQTEEELLHLAEIIEVSEGSIVEKGDKVLQLQEGVSEEEAASSSELQGYEKAISSLSSRETAARGDVSKRVLYKYDFIRSRRPGSAICAAKDSHCEGCFMAFTPQLYIEVQRAETLACCPNCHRILYYWEDGLAEVQDTATS